MYNPKLLYKPFGLYGCDRIPKTVYGCGREEIAMSIGLALIGTDGIVMATDSKLVIHSDGQTEERNFQKLWIMDNNIGLMMAGGDAALAESYRRHFYLHKDTVIDWDIKSFEEKSQIFAAFIRDEFKSYGGDTPLAKKLTGYQLEYALVGHFDGTPKIAYMYSFDDRVPFYVRYAPCCFVLGVDPIANYWIHKLGLHNGTPTQNVNTLVNIAIMIINETSMIYKDYVGGDIQMAIIKYPEITPRMISCNPLRESINNIMTKNSHDVLQSLKEIME